MEMSTMESMSPMETVTAMTPMPTMPATGRCDVWRDCYGTDSNGTGKGDENFAQLHGISSSEHRVRRLMLFPVAYMGLNREPLSRAQGICAEAPKVSYNVVVAVHESVRAASPQL